MIKLEIRSFTISYSSKKKKEGNKLEKNLHNRINVLQEIIDNQKASDQHFEEFYSTKNEIEQIEEYKTVGAMLHSKAKWVEDGEKNTAFFLNLEKRNFSNKLISQLQVGDDIISEPTQILKEEKTFFDKLYSEVENVDFNKHCNKLINNNDIPQLTEAQKEFCEHNITEEELTKCIKLLKNGKTPGTNGLPCDFYKFFWLDIKQLLLCSINYCLQNGELSVE